MAHQWESQLRQCWKSPEELDMQAVGNLQSWGTSLATLHWVGSEVQTWDLGNSLK